MKHNKILMLIVLVMAFASAAIAFADDTMTLTAGSQPVNVRSGPGVQYSVRGVLNPGFALPMTGRNDFNGARSCVGRDSDMEMWVRVTFNELEGWVNRCAVVIDGEVSSLPVVNASSTEIAADIHEGTLLENEGGSEPDHSITMFASARANLRSAPNLSGNVLGILPFNAPIFVTGRTSAGGWLRVQFGDSVGWVAAHLVIKPGDWLSAVPVVQ